MDQRKLMDNANTVTDMAKVNPNEITEIYRLAVWRTNFYIIE